TRRQILGILPKEAEDKYDTKQKAIGSGVVYLSDYKPSIGFTVKRHTGHYDAQKAYADQADYPIITEYAQAYAQFRAGNLHYYEFMRGEDVLPTKSDLPQLSLYQDAVVADGWRTMFGQLPTPDGKKSPFLDERVRQAYSMAINRDLWIDVIFAVSDFEKAGLALEKRWNTALQASAFEGWWLDPRSKDFGPNAKYFEHNLTEAKKLLSAAGFPNGMQLQSYISSTGFGPDDVKLIQIIEGFAGEAGFQITPKLIDYNRDYVPNYRDSEGQFSGIGYKSGPAPPASEASARLINDFYSKSATTRYGYDVKGVGDNSGDPFVDSKLDAARTEFDNAKRMAIVHELQRYLAKTQYAIRSPGGANRFSLVWPAVQNYGVFNSDQPTRLRNKTWWLDQTKAPFKS
ncbi:MAG TPA: ABC transporter substrate-binding protein, partial [Dehalococcoidia bacterium]|nr:ABC transporter substrate-binding protein [Dehalococcoidia bacterium]